MVTNELSGNVVDLCPVGALNNLPYSFTARPWELKSNYTVDVMDSLGSNIDVHTRGSDTMRILPRLNDEVNEEWISDKSRHAFDGLRKQRLHIPFLRQPDGSFKELTLQEALTIAAQKLSSVQGHEIQGIIGQFNDVESILAFKDVLNRLNCDNIDVRKNVPAFKADFRSQYLMNSRITGIDETDLLILVGCNPRNESPVLNARIRKAVGVNGLKVAMIGSAPNLPYNYTHLGNTPQTLKDLADGTHPFSAELAKADLPMIILSSTALERTDGEGILNYIYKLGETTNVINKKEKWNGINILHSEASRVGALDLGIVPRNELKSGKAKVVYLLGADNFRHEEIPEDAFVIYQGHTGDEGAYYADLIIPGASYLEKQALFVNTDGRPQQSRSAQAPPGFAREDWMILRALSEELGTPLPYDSVDEVRTRMAELAPHLVKFDVIENSGFEELALRFNPKNTKLNKTPLTDNIDNFY
jgi:NADH dehydrogenase (ubiquinone) Fe-S protein 1